VKGGPRNVDAMERVKVSKLLKSGGLCLQVGGFDFTADLVDGFRDEGGVAAGDIEADAFYQIVKRTLKQRVHQ
jgi:hypothetical protein